MISEKTKAILLITAYLPGGGKNSAKPLSTKEWNRFAVWLNNKQLSPEDLLSSKADQILSQWIDTQIDVARIRQLLQRGAALAIALDKWLRAGIWIINRGDPEYPIKIKERLKKQSPPIFFGIGNRKLLNTPAIGVVGSRHTTDEDLQCATDFGKSIANQEYAVVSGGAKGIDEHSMLGSLNSGGYSIGIMADSLLRKASSKIYRRHIMENNLVMISPFNPEARFNVGNAMGRNKYIYCMSDATVVIHSGKKGGTWTGAIENINHKWTPLWVKQNADSEAGNKTLITLGGNPLPVKMEDWKLEVLTKQKPHNGQQGNLFAPQKAVVKTTTKPQPLKKEPKISASEVSKLPFYEIFLAKCKTLTGQDYMKAEEIFTNLNITPTQGKVWLKHALEEGFVEKVSRPVRYRWKQS